MPDPVAVVECMGEANQAQSVEADPLPGTLAFSRALSRERERVRLELEGRQLAALSALLQSLRTATGASAAAGLPAGVTRAIHMASRALVGLQTEEDAVDLDAATDVAVVFAELEEELRSALRPGGVELVSNVAGDDGDRAPQDVAQAACHFSRVATLAAMDRKGTERLRLRWRLTDQDLTVTVADNGVADDRESLARIRWAAAGLGARVDVDAHPDWGTTVTAMFPLQREAPTPGHPTVSPLAELGDREQEVLQLIGAGLRNREIAARLYISERTVKFHVSNILAKLQVESRTEVIALAHAAGTSGGGALAA